MENALIRGRASHPAVLDDAVLIGPHAHVNGARGEAEVFVATGVSMFPGAVAGAGSELRFNSVLHVNSKLAPRTVVPIGWIAAGDPARLFSPDQHDELWEVQRDWISPARSTGFNEARRCARSWPARRSPTERTEAIPCSTHDAERPRHRAEAPAVPDSTARRSGTGGRASLMSATCSARSSPVGRRYSRRSGRVRVRSRLRSCLLN
jgi:hypothetical protein